MTLGISLGNSLGLGGNFMPDVMPITRLWTPLDTTTNFWYDNLSYQNFGPGGTITEITNRSGNHSHLQVNGTGQPGTPRNSLPTIFLNSASNAFGTVQTSNVDQTWFIVFKPGLVDDVTDTPLIYNDFILEVGANNYYNWDVGGTDGPDLLGSAMNDYHIMAITFDRVNQTFRDRINGCPVYLGGNPSESSDTAGLTQNGTLTLALNMGMTLAELICLPSAVEVDIQTVEGYLANKWVIPICASNPFSSGPPTVTSIGQTRYLTNESGDYIEDNSGNQIIVQG